MGPAPFIAGVVALAVGSAFARGVVRRRRAERRATWLETLAAAARRGRSLARVLSGAAEAERKGARREALASAARALDGGESLADALGRSLPKEVPASVAESIRAAEGTARLPDVLEGLARDADRGALLAHRVAMAAAYPAILGAGLLLLHLAVLEGRLVDLDLAVEPVEVVSTPVVVARWLFVALAAAVLLPWLLSRLARTASEAATAAWLRTTSWSLAAGRGLPTALRHAAGAARRGLRRATTGLADEIEAGRPVDGALGSIALPSRVRARLSAVAGVPAPGVLDEMAASCEARHAARAERWIRWSVPVATVAIGLVIAVDYAVLADVWRRAAEAVR